MPTREQKLRIATNALAKINGLHTVKDLAGRVALGRVTSDGPNGRRIYTVPQNSKIEQSIIQLFIDSSEGSLTTTDLIQELNDILGGEGEQFRDPMYRSFQVFYTQEKQDSLLPTELRNSDNKPDDISKVLAYGEGQPSSSPINSAPNNPTKEAPGLSVILSNNHRIGLVQRDTNPSVIFLNAIPSVEMARAVPFVDVEFSLGRPAKNERTKQIQALSLPRFLLGAQRTSGGPLDAMVSGNQILDPEGDPAKTRAVAGIELFTTPQTLVNANEVDNESLRSNPVLDKFKSFMTLTSLDIQVVPSTGLMSFKTAKLKMTLHDRSRLSEIADFVRADLYGKTEIGLEYGWIHPDGESTEQQRNPYGDLINGMRLKEKYSVVNSSFSMTENGEVNITLQLAMRGAAAFSTELISSDAEGFGNSLREIENLQSLVAELRSRVFGQGNGFVTREIRGVQILDAAQDALNHTTFTSNLRDEMKNFRNALNQSTNPSAQPLINAIEQLYGNARTENQRGATTGAIGNLRRSVQDSVRQKMQKLSSTSDPFIKLSTPRPPGARGGGRFAQNAATSRQRTNVTQIREQNNISGVSTGTTSLAKLFLLFVGEPLANTGKFDDVQMIFYPFNAYAGQASKVNIGNFAVDNEYFAESFARWRLDRIGRSANVNLRDFLGFFAATIIDDPSAISYGLWENDQSLFRQVVTGEDGSRTIGLEAADDPANHIARLERILRGVTPDGTFRMPQIDIYLESTPEKVGQRDGDDSRAQTGKTILKVHVYDRQATSYDTLGTLLANSRNTEIAALGRIPQAPPVSQDDNGATGNEGVVESRRQLHNSFLSAAEQSGIIEAIGGTGKSSGGPGKNRGPQMYRVVGGPRAIKEFLYSTTPYIIYGTAGTNLLNANLSSQQVPELNTINLLRSFRRSELEPNGENPGGLPLRIIPTELSFNAMGCPLLQFAQQYFVDFNTGTTADNLYGIMALDHSLKPGEFQSTIRMAPLDAYGRYVTLIDRSRDAQAVLQDIENLANENEPDTTSSTGDPTENS